MTTSTLQPRLESLRELFGPIHGQPRCYSVPQYQRDYAWEARAEVADLLNDLKEYLDDPRQTKYLMGQIITTRSTTSSAANTFDIIDGQQRCTTLYLVLLWFLREISRRINQQSAGMTPLTQRLYATHNEVQLLLDTELAVEPEERSPRLLLPYSDGTATLRNLLREVDITTRNISRSQERIIAAFAEIDRQFGEYFGCERANLPTENNTKRLLESLSKLSNSVLIINLEVSDTADALDLFEKLNHRGKGLDDADLIKNMLFQRVDEQYYDEISTHWEQAKRSLNRIQKNARIAQMTYLLRSIAWTKSGGERVSSRQVYDFWKTRLNPLSEAPIDARRFSVELPDWAESLARLAENLSPLVESDNEQQPSLQLIREMNFIQQYPLLLAGRHLPESVFERLLGLVERRFLVSAFAYERPGEFDRVIVRWANAISQAGTSEDEIVSASLRVAFDSQYDLLQHRAMSNIPMLSYDVAKERDLQRILLAYLSHKIQERCGERSSLSELLKGSQSGTSGYDLDHVWPKSNTSLDSRHTIGNLVLAHPQDQRLALAASPSAKERVYSTTQLELTRSLCEPMVLGSRSERVSTVTSELQSFAPPSLQSWGPSSVQARLELYLGVFQKFTCVPALEEASTDVSAHVAAISPSRVSAELTAAQPRTPDVAVGTLDAPMTQPLLDAFLAASTAAVQANRHSSIKSLAQTFAPSADPNYKGIATYAIRSMLENSTENLVRTAGALGIEIRSCRIRAIEQTPFESISFSSFDPVIVARTPWPLASDIIPRKPILFFVFVQSTDDKLEAKLDRLVFWQADQGTLSVMEHEYEKFRSEINSGKPRPKLLESKTSVLHVRPKGRNSNDLVLLPNGTEFPRSSFWLNHNFLARIVASEPQA